MGIRKRIEGGYHHLMGEIYKLRIMLSFKYVDRLLGINQREGKKLATADNWRDIYRKSEQRRRRIDMIFRHERELERMRDRHWCDWQDAKAYYRA